MFKLESLTLWLTAVVLCLAASDSLLIADEIKPVNQWKGRFTQNDLKRFAPANQMIRDAEAWKNVWNNWRPDEQIPNVDFENNMIVVATTQGRNEVRLHRLNLAPGGNLQFAAASSRMRGPGFGYLMIEVPAIEIKMLNGRPVPAKADGVKPPKMNDKDSIQIEVVGFMRSGVVAVGGESTGFTITSGGMTFEMDVSRFRIKDPNLKRGRVAGKLRVLKGVEVKQRFVIDIEKIEFLEDEAGDGKDKDQQAGKMNFKEIVIRQTGGIAGMTIDTVVQPKGKIKRVNDRTRVTESFELKAKSLTELNELIGKTDWAKLQTPAPDNRGADMIEYSITLKTSDGKHEYKMNGMALRKQPVLKRMMELIQQR